MPAGYQFGDAAWRPPHENAAAQLARQAEPHAHAFEVFNPAYMAYFCRCGAQRDRFGVVTEPEQPRPLFLEQLQAHGHWNVIEGEDH